ncbi:hypothetical protein ACIRFH_34620 [Streptomyces sp. NPDC093586]|uniref:hypothetical protein n=1 Tax=Streptomyces sp. NPDC093586 TaxID=3366042 RepID=UPI0038137EC6
MGNFFGGESTWLSLSNGSTAALLDVLMLAVSDLAARPWDYRFAALLALQDQNVIGRGAAGFDVTDIDWGADPSEAQQNKEFVLAVIDLAARRHRWDELD